MSYNPILPEIIQNKILKMSRFYMVNNNPILIELNNQIKEYGKALNLMNDADKYISLSNELSSNILILFTNEYQKKNTNNSKKIKNLGRFDQIISCHNCGYIIKHNPVRNYHFCNKNLENNELTQVESIIMDIWSQSLNYLENIYDLVEQIAENFNLWGENWNHTYKDEYFPTKKVFLDRLLDAPYIDIYILNQALKCECHECVTLYSKNILNSKHFRWVSINDQQGFIHHTRYQRMLNFNKTNEDNENNKNGK